MLYFKKACKVNVRERDGHIENKRDNTPND